MLVGLFITAHGERTRSAAGDTISQWTCSQWKPY